MRRGRSGSNRVDQGVEAGALSDKDTSAGGSRNIHPMIRKRTVRRGSGGGRMGPPGALYARTDGAGVRRKGVGGEMDVDKKGKICCNIRVSGTHQKNGVAERRFQERRTTMNQNTKRMTMGLVGLAGLLVAAGMAMGFINPNFSPIHLVNQSDLIVQLKFDKPDAEGKVKATVVKVFKGEGAPKELTVDLMAGAFEAQGKMVAGMIESGVTEALLFTGSFQEEGGEGGFGGEGGATGMLHLGGQWVILSQFEETVGDMQKVDARMLGTWAGSTDMFIRALNYILSDEKADVPVRVNAEWAASSIIAEAGGKITSIQAVDVEGDGKLTVLVTSDAGDKMVAWNGEKFEDVTAKVGLKSKSVVAAWVDGKLLSYDGKSLTYGDKKVADAAGCSSLDVVRWEKGKTCVIIGQASVPMMMQIAPEAGKPEAIGAAPAEKAGEGDGRCVVADFDGDSQTDVLQMFERGSVFYKGEGKGKFAAGVATSAALGIGVSAVTMGDYDADGLPDLFTTAQDTNRIWQNLGSGKFVDMIGQSGEIAYISKPGGNGAATGDVNNDGRQDILVAYTAAAPHIFFNRGFRSTGHGRELDAGEINPGSDVNKGTQAVCLGDFNGDGAQDMVIALKNGKVWYYPRAVMDGTALSLTVQGKGLTEPILVSGWVGDRPMGSWKVTEGGAGAFFGLLDAGKVTLKWRVPGGEEQSKSIRVLDKPVRFVLPTE